MDSLAPYPAPPWETYGFGVICPYLVREKELELPPELEPVSFAGSTLGLLGYIEYRPPSPLSYAELLWLPATVRYRDRDGRRHQGYFVARMYVDLEASLQAGRDVWALPKSLARFQREADGVAVEAGDGSHLELAFRGVGPGLWTRSRMSTLQVKRPGVVRFRADFAGIVGAARVEVRKFASTHPGWAGFESAKSLLKMGSLLERFESTMRAPTQLE